jgi:hypothetical protein
MNLNNRFARAGGSLPMITQNKQHKYLNLNSFNSDDNFKYRWNIPNLGLSSKSKIALVGINSSNLNSNLNFIFCPSFKNNNYNSSINNPPLIYSGVGYDSKNLINGKHFYDINGANLNEIELNIFSSPPINVNGNISYDLPTNLNKYNYSPNINNLAITTINPTFINGLNNYYYSFITGTTNITLNKDIICDILIIGGGGSGGCRHSGGGGAGALIYLKNQSLTAGSYSIVIGQGGSSVYTTQSVGANGINGGDTIIKKSGTEIYKAKGGGGGASYNQTTGGLPGGSSGGSGADKTIVSQPPLTTNIPTGTYGNYGGKASDGGSGNSAWAGGGGGGAGENGGDATTDLIAIAGKGGNGILINITGKDVYYAGGGGGGVGTGGGLGNGGLGGGGNGSISNANAVAGVANTGGGGGGSGFATAGNGASGAGGSGLVIISINELLFFNFEIQDEDRNLIKY